MIIRIRLPTIYTPAMIGTTFSTTDASLCVPPRKTNAATAATITPMTTGEIVMLNAPKASVNAAPIELA